MRVSQTQAQLANAAKTDTKRKTEIGKKIFIIKLSLPSKLNRCSPKWQRITFEKNSMSARLTDCAIQK